MQIEVIAKALSVLRGKPEVQEQFLTVALIGNPNAGKTALFNALTGLRSRTANYPGTTVERKVGRMEVDGHHLEIIDLPGMYSLRAVTPEELVARSVLLGELPGARRPDGVILILDADNLERSLFLVSQIRELELPVIAVLNMVDVAARHGVQIDTMALATELQCPVVPMVATARRGLDQLQGELARWVHARPETPPPLSQPVSCDSCRTGCGCPKQFRNRFDWSERITTRCVRTTRVPRDRLTERIDRFLTHPVVGLISFLAVMLTVFYLIFSVATVPMDLIDALFVRLGAVVATVLPDGDFRSLIVHGIIGGVGGILVFLPQICILFFFLALLEDTGYLARAAFVMDRLMRRIGLPGTAFVPLLSAHACAIPAIMATRVIKDRRDRLVTILVAPLMTCSARIPVYAMITALLFPDAPVKAALVFTGAYAVGITAALTMAFVFKHTILPGETRPLVLELPGYRLPSLRSSLLYTYDRAKVFIQQAGTIILLISVILWGLSTYPKSAPPPAAAALETEAAALAASGDAAGAATIAQQAETLTAREQLANSYAGRLGHLIEPAVRPLGFDWQVGIGIVSSFAAREVIVSTLAIVYGVGGSDDGSGANGLYATLRAATRHDGRPVFTTASSLSLLVFYILAMQCLPTQAVTRRETGTWKWAIFQLVYMTILAYGASLLTFQGLVRLGLG